MGRARSIGDGSNWSRGKLGSSRRAPWPFIRGCIRTDGCSFVNRTGPYEYLSYDFSNMSDDIVRLFVDACERVGVDHARDPWKRGGVSGTYESTSAPSVALMLEHVGMKT